MVNPQKQALKAAKHQGAKQSQAIKTRIRQKAAKIPSENGHQKIVSVTGDSDHVGVLMIDDIGFDIDMVVGLVAVSRCGTCGSAVFARSRCGYIVVVILKLARKDGPFSAQKIGRRHGRSLLNGNQIII